MRKILAFAFAFILLIGMTSALEIDNVKSYDKDLKEITIKNSILGIPTTEIAKIRLNTPLEYKVPRGYQMVAEFTINLSNDAYANALKTMEFYDMKDSMLKEERVFDYKRKVMKNKTVNILVEECKEGKILNLTTGKLNQECKYITNGTKQETYIDYELISKDLTKGVVTIGIFTNVEKGDKVEWIPTFFGVKISEWATWTESMNVGLVAGYNFEQSSGTNLPDVVAGINNGTLYNTPQWLTGKIGNGLNFTDGSSTYVNIPDSNTFDFTGDFSFSYWIKPADLLDGMPFTKFSDSSGMSWQHIYGTDPVFAVDINTPSEDHLRTYVDVNGFYSAGTWLHVVMTYQKISDGNSIGIMYINGNAYTTKTTMNEPLNPSTTAIWLAGRAYSGSPIYWSGTMDELYMWNRTLSAQEINDTLYNAGNGNTYTAEFSGMTINNSAPTNYANLTTTSISIYCNITATGNRNLTSVSLNATNGTTWTQTITGINTQNYNATFTNTTLINGAYSWNCIGYGSDGVNVSSSIWDFTNDATAPYFVLNSLDNVTTFSLPVNVTLNVTTIDSNLQTCLYSTNDNLTNHTFSCNTNQNISFQTGGIKNINVMANDTFGNYNNTNYTVYIYDFNNTITGQDTTSEGTAVSFSLLINSTSFPIGDASASLIYDGVDNGYSTKTILDANSIYFTKIINVPLGAGNSTGKSVNWSWSYNTTQINTINTDNQTQIVFSIDVGECGAIFTNLILNMTLRNEELNSLINISNVTASNIELEIDIVSIYNVSLVWNFSKTWANNNTVAICVPSNILNSSNYTVDFTAEYSATDYVTEFYYMDNGTLSNSCSFNDYTSCHISLMDLLLTDSTTFLFEYTDSDGLKVENAIVHVYRKYIGDGTFREVERARQDNNGQTHVHLVQEDVIYYFAVSQDGEIVYTSNTYNAKCLSAPCKISLSGAIADTNWSLIDNEGRKYAVSTDKSTRLVTTTFNTGSIDLINVSLYEVVNGEASLVNTTSITATAGSLDLYVPLPYGNKTFFVEIWNNNHLVSSDWVDMTASGFDYFGTTGALLGGIVVVAIMLMAVAEGIGFIVFTILALAVISIMQLIDLSWMALISIICAGFVIIFKLVSRRQQA